MKNKVKILSYITGLWALALVFVSCDDEETRLFPEDRNEAGEIQKINDKLVAEAYGWKFVYLPEGQQSGGYNMTVKFNADGFCEMIADYSNTYDNYSAAVTRKNIAYKVRKVTSFELSFQSYSFIHKMYDYGYGNGFDFRISLTEGDSVLLADGTSTFYMTPATAEDWDMLPYNLTEQKFQEFRNSSTLFNYLKGEEGPQVQLAWNADARTVGFYYFNASGALASQRVGYYYTHTGIKFKEEVTVYGYESISELKFINVEEDGNYKKLNVIMNGNRDGKLFTSVRTMVPVDDGLEHFHIIEGSSAYSGRFWSSRPQFERGFHYGDSTTYFGIENSPYFVDFNIYLNYYNSAIPAEYDNFSFVFSNPFTGNDDFHNVYFTYETKGTDQIYFSLDSVKGDNGFSGSFNPVIKDLVTPMVDKLIQPEGFTIVSLPGMNAIDGHYSMYMVDNKDNGYIYMRTGELSVQ